MEKIKTYNRLVSNTLNLEILPYMVSKTSICYNWLI